MASSINASTSGAGGVITTADNTGILNIQTANTTAVTVDASQNVGIGTTSPLALLNVNKTTTGSANAIVISRSATNNNDSQSISWQASDLPLNYASIGAIATSTTGSLTFSTASGGTNTERMRIDSSGNVLIGATSQVQVGRFCIQTDLNTYNGMVINDTGSAVSVAYAYFSRSATTKGSITYNSGSNLVAYNTSSDYRLKENIVDLPNGLDAVLQLKPRQFDWKENGNTTTGFIAHELAEVCPHAVTGTKDEVDKDGKPVYQGVDTSFLVATLTAAIQEQQTIINDLKARVETLEAK